MSVTWGEAIFTFASYVVTAAIAYRIGYDFGWLKGMKTAGDILEGHIREREEEE